MLSHGSVVIAAITSCTNTSNPSVMLGAGGCTALLFMEFLEYHGIFEMCILIRVEGNVAVTLLLTVIWHKDKCSSSRTPCEKGNRVRLEREAVHKDQPVTRQWSGHLLPKAEWCYGLPLSAGVSCSNSSYVWMIPNMFVKKTKSHDMSSMKVHSLSWKTVVWHTQKHTVMEFTADKYIDYFIQYYVLWQKFHTWWQLSKVHLLRKTVRCSWKPWKG